MSTPVSPLALDRRALARSFDRAGRHYDEAARLQRRVRQELLERLQYFTLEPRWIVDLGAGTCQASAALRQRFKRARVLSIDLAVGMLRAAPRRWWRRAWPRVCADAVALPLPSQCADLVFSNLMLQWCDAPDTVFREVARVLKPGGLFVFSSFGPRTLQELRHAWESADGGEHVSAFAALPQLGEALMHSGLLEPVLDVEQHCLHYPDVQALMRELKRVGAHNAASGRARGLTGRGRMRAMTQAYEQLRTAQGLPARYEVVYGAAFGAGQTPPAPAPAPGEFALAVQSVRRSGR